MATVEEDRARTFRSQPAPPTSCGL